MGKIKNFVTGIFSKKNSKDDEIMQIQPASDPDRELVEYENRYETPDYQAFLHDMGYIDKNQIRSSDACTEDHAEASQDIDPDEVLEEGSYVEGAYEAPHPISPDEVLENSCGEAVCETPQTIVPDEILEENSSSEVMGETSEDSIRKSSEANEQPLCEVDQEFIEEGIAELGVNDVWSEEES